MHARFHLPDARGRRLSEARAPNTPAWHERTGGWVVGWADWRALAKEAHRLADADAAKMHWWSEGAHGQLPIEASAGHPLLDARIPPSTVGRALRVLAHSLRGRTPVGAWRARARAQRGCRRAQPAPRRARGARAARGASFCPRTRLRRHTWRARSNGATTARRRDASPRPSFRAWSRCPRGSRDGDRVGRLHAVRGDGSLRVGAALRGVRHRTGAPARARPRPPAPARDAHARSRGSATSTQRRTATRTRKSGRRTLLRITMALR